MKRRKVLLSKLVALLKLMVLSVAMFPLVSSVQAATQASPARVEGWMGNAALTGAHIDRHGDGSRVVFDLAAPVRFGIIALTDPYRIVIELEELNWQLGRRQIATGDGIVSQIRYGLFRPGTSRIVLDCAQPAVVDAAYLDGTRSGGYQLVIDLAPVSHAAFLRALEAQSVNASLSDLQVPHQPSRKDAESGVGLPPEAALFVRSVAAPVSPELQLAALPFAPPPRKPLSRPGKRIIVIDPGHGGVDPGAISASGVKEKTVTLRLARLLREELRRTGRYNVVMTRDSDESIRLRDRVALARASDPDLFISIHADANPNNKVRGASVYTLSEKASDAEAAALAERENKADLISGVDLSREAPEVANILIDLAQRETMNQSARVAKHLVKHLGKRTALIRNTHRFAGFAVLKAPDVPAVLVELGHLSNAADVRLLQQERYLRSLAIAIAEAANAYFAIEARQ